MRYVVEFDHSTDKVRVVDTLDGTIVFNASQGNENGADDARIICDDWNYANSFPQMVACEFDA